MSNKKRISKIFKVKYKAKRYFKSKLVSKNDSHFFDNLRDALLKDYPTNLDFQREYLNFPVPKNSITFIPEERFPAIPINRNLYLF